MADFKKGDILIKRALIGIAPSEWPVGTRAEVISPRTNGEPEVRELVTDEVRWIDMKYWKLEGDLPARAGNISASKQNNDNRDTCYSCGAPTRVLDTHFPSSCMRVCTKCEK